MFTIAATLSSERTPSNMSGKSSAESHGISEELSNVDAGQLRRHASSLVLRIPFLGQMRSMSSMSTADNDLERHFDGFWRTPGLGEGACGKKVNFQHICCLILL